MPHFQSIEVSHWVEARVLHFLNQAQTTKDITEHPSLLDDPSNGVAGTTIGATVAQRLIDRRNRLPWDRYDSVSQIEGIQGFGVDKFNDLVYSFGKSAHDAFRAGMFNGVIRDNWKMTDYTDHFPNDTAFRMTVQNDTAFRQWVGYRMQRAWTEQGLDAQLAEAKRKLLQQSYIEVFDIQHYAAIELAFYLYQFDADNWFSFDRVREECEHYLSYYPSWQLRQELRMFKGFNKQGLQATSTQQGTMPVIVNYAERAITIWQVELFD